MSDEIIQPAIFRGLSDTGQCGVLRVKFPVSGLSPHPTTLVRMKPRLSRRKGSYKMKAPTSTEMHVMMRKPKKAALLCCGLV